MFKIYVANATRETLARIGQELGVSGTVYDALGFGAWGIEPTVVVELGEADGLGRTQAWQFALAALAAYPDEESVYVVYPNGQGTVFDSRALTAVLNRVADRNAVAIGTWLCPRPR